MTNFNVSTLFAFLLLLLCFSTAIAQETAQATATERRNESTNEPKISYKPVRGSIENNFEPGYSPFEPTHFAGPKEYNTAGRKLGTSNFRIGRVIGTKKNIAYTYLFGFTPLVIGLKNEVTNSAYISPALTPNIAPTKRETTYGAGVAPANFRFTFLAKNKIKPFAQTGAGILIFNKSLPIPESRRFQFAGDFGGGLIYHTSPERFWTFGYKYLHISNAGQTPKIYNPGFNANVFYLGYSFFR
jgi:hypothetical protein